MSMKTDYKIIEKIIEKCVMSILDTGVSMLLRNLCPFKVVIALN